MVARNTITPTREEITSHSDCKFPIVCHPVFSYPTLILKQYVLTCYDTSINVINASYITNTVVDMVKRGGKEVVTVEIFKETYELMKSNAERMRWNTKEYINTVLAEAIERDKFLQTYAPFLSKVGYQDNILFIRDAKVGKTAEIYLKDRALYCGLCESKDCMHIHYAFALPEVAKMFLKKPGGRQ